MRTLAELKPIILSVLAHYPIRKAGIFGSYARGTQRVDSDIDILVEFEDQNHIFENYFSLLANLEDALGIEVDLVEYHLVKPLIKNEIFKNEIRLFDRTPTSILVPA